MIRRSRRGRRPRGRGDSGAGLIFAWHAGYDVSALRMCVSGGAALPVEVPRGFEEAFGCPVLEGYGLSRKPGSIGMPIRGAQMRVVDSGDRGVQMRVVDSGDRGVPQDEVGEIVIRGPNVMKGYWHPLKATAEALRGGWSRTGDLARVDEDGYFFIVDRKFAACQERGDLVTDQIVLTC